MPGGDRSAPIRIENVHPNHRIDRDRLTRTLLQVAAGEGASIADVTVILTGHEQVLSLNQTYLDHDYVTDVLSFDLSDPDAPGIEGEIYIDLDTARERHAEFGAEMEDEVLRYAIHGLLHLIGYLDDTPDQRKHMNALESRYLAGKQDERRPSEGRP